MSQVRLTINASTMKQNFPPLTNQRRASRTLGAWVIVAFLVLSQYLGFVHTITHGFGIQSRAYQADSSLVQSMLDAHTGDAKNQLSNSEGGFNLSCKLFDAAMLCLGFACGLLSLGFSKTSFDSLRVSFNQDPQCSAVLAYSSRAPPLACS